MNETAEETNTSVFKKIKNLSTSKTSQFTLLLGVIIVLAGMLINEKECCDGENASEAVSTNTVEEVESVVEAVVE